VWVSDDQYHWIQMINTIRCIDYCMHVATGKALKGKREQYTLATKFGLVPHADGKGADVDGSSQHVRAACEASLKRLQTDYIDLYYQHRVDRKVGIETTVREMKVVMSATLQLQKSTSS